MTIGAMAQRTGLTESKLRYYEKKGLLQVARDGGGRRDYDEGDVEWVAFICRLKETGMLLRDIRRYAELRARGRSTMAERLAMLEVHRAYVQEQQEKWMEHLNRLEDKIAFYRAETARLET
ncbi:MAG: MerR family transcriptional regulator [Lawsonibacter sp.]|jgi:DNA-binding transcriptional MerR regulator|nr:MerR family transcriptional regulator [Lawsonibacter sp.]